MNMQDDLAALFSRQMNMGSPRPHTDDERASYAVPTIAYSVSQHYHHSSHVTSKTPASQTSQEMSSSGFETSAPINDILIRHNVDPESLSPSQRQLFEHAIPEQQLRLLQIWQICSKQSEINCKPDIVETKALHNLSRDIEMCEAVKDGNDNGNGDDDIQRYAEDYMVSGYGIFPLGGGDPSVGKIAPLVNENASGSLYNPANDPVYQYQGQRW